MSTACGRPQGGGGVRPMWTPVERGGQKSDFFVDVINGWPLSGISFTSSLLNSVTL